MNGLQAHLVVHRSQSGHDFELNIELEIKPGETLALLGPNGAGKSTTVAALAGLEPISEGHITLNGRTLDHGGAGFVAPADRRIGVVFQDYLLFDHLTVIDNVMFGLLAQGQPRKHAHTQARQWLDALQLGELAERRPRTLSGGQAQRVALARALATEPELLLLDEALAALDIETRSELRRVLARHLAEFAGPRLFITHDPTDAFLLADRIAIVENGRVTQVGTSDEIRRRPASRYVAAVAGTNLLRGTAASGTVSLDGGATLQAADTSVNGPVLVTVHPTAIAVHTSQPSGSPRNSWATAIDSIEPLGDTTRITLASPLPLGVDITPGAARSLGLQSGSNIWVSIKATEIDVTPAAHPDGYPDGSGGNP